MGYSPWGRIESDMTKQPSTHTHTTVPARDLGRHLLQPLISERTKLC